MILIRFILIGLIVYLITRSFMRFGEEKKSGTHIDGSEKRSNVKNKKVSRKIGEYVDYEEIDK